MYYRDPHLKKPNRSAWYGNDPASVVISNEFFGIPTPPAGLIFSIGGAGVGVARINGGGGLAIVDGTI